MSIPDLTREQYADRLEWLSSGVAAVELDRALERGDAVDVLDQIKHAAEQCAKHLRAELSAASGKVRP